MRGHRTIGLGLLTGLVGAAALLPASPAAEKDAAVPISIHVGMMQSYFPGAPDEVVQTMMRPFKALMEVQGGFKGDMIPVARAEDLGQRIAENKLHVGVFHGFEFAWAQQKYPQLKPLVTAVNHHPLYAYLMVRRDSNTAGLADLRDKLLALPASTRVYSRLYLERGCQALGAQPKTFFKQITSPADMEDALEDVIEGKVQATVVDSLALHNFEQRKPGRFGKLKTAERSACFPAAVIAYRPGSMDEATFKKMREGLINTSQTRRGQQLLALSRVKGFEQPPAGFDRELADVLKAYPPPEADGAK